MLEWHSDNTTNPATLITDINVELGTYCLFETTPNGCYNARRRSTGYVVQVSIDTYITVSHIIGSNDNDL